MAEIIEQTGSSRRVIKLSVDDVIAVVREYQRKIKPATSYEVTRMVLKHYPVYLPEDL